MIYVALELGEFVVAVFWDRDAADRFVLRENNTLEVEYMFVEEVPLIDQYGYPCAMKDIRFVAPWICDVPPPFNWS
jgi:hypothetical protein